VAGRAQPSPSSAPSRSTEVCGELRPPSIVASHPVATPGTDPADSIAIPLGTVIARLPGELQAKVVRPPASAASVRVSSGLILEQLPRGSVKIALSELVKASPPGTFDGTLASSTKLVELPLEEILPRLRSGHLGRRPNQKQVQVPVDITPIFGAKGEHLVPLVACSVNKNGAAAAPAITPATPPTTAAPPSVRNGFAVRQGTAMAVTPGAASSRSLVEPTRRAVGSGESPRVAPGHNGVPLPQHAPVPALPRTTESNDVVEVPLELLMETWPQPVCQEIVKLKLGRHLVALPIHEIEPQIKRGKVLARWREVRAWLKPAAPGPLVSPNDESALELRLSAIVPLFLTRRELPKARRTAPVAPTIPNLFTGPTAPAAPAHLAESTAVPSPSMGETEPASAPEAGPALPELSQIFGQPEKRHWTPTEIVEHTARLTGVAGVVIALQDGLIVASELPSNLNGEAFAAFLPQMHSRLAKCTKEMNLGEPSRICLLLDHVPLSVVKMGRIFFACLGRTGQDLPESTLSAIATHLARQSK